MKHNGVVGLMVLVVAGFICGSAAAQSVSAAKSSIAEPTQKSQLAKDYGRLPLSFEINHGQTDPPVKFLSRGAGETLFLTSNEAVLALSKSFDSKPGSLGFPSLSVPHSLRTTFLRMKLLGANLLADVTGQEPLPGTSNYFIGNDPAKWRANVPTYGKVRYSQIYPGIDLVYYGNQHQLEYDFVVAPGADPAQIRLAIRGASKLSIDADGNAVVRWKDGDVRLLKPRLYQEVRGEKIEIAGGYALKGNELRFAVGQYNRRQRLVIDPVLVYSTYLGGINNDGASGVAVDSAGNAYVVGTTSYTGFPTTSGVFQPTSQGATNAFVAKLNAAGTALLYSTYLGGNGQDTGYAIAVDSSGSAYLTGATFGSNFPITSGAFQTTTKPVATPGSTVFVTKLSPDGSSLAYSTYLGGSANDSGFAIAVDASGSAYVVGETQSGNFPVRGSSPKVVGGPISCDSLNSGGSYDGFITKFSPGGDTVAYSLYLGGSGTDVATGVAVDSSGDAYVAGYTTSKDFLVFNTCPGPGPGPSSLQPANAGADNGFIVKVSPDGTAFLGSTYLGGSGQDAITSIAVDGSGFVYLAGEGNSGGAGGLDAIGAKLNGSLDTSSKVYFNYIGGSGFDRATGVAVDSAGNEYLVGQTASTNFPQVSPLQPAFGGGTYDAFITELSPSGTIVFSTYLGGSGDESTSIGGGPIAVDSSGNIYVAGTTTSANFPGVTSSSIQPANGGGQDAFIVKLGPSVAPTVTALVTSVNPAVFGQQVSFTVTVSPSSSSPLTPSGNVTISDGSTALGTVALTSGTAIYNTTTLSVGSHSVSASYAGDSNFAASASTPLTQLVNQGATTASVLATPNPGIVGQPVTLTATIAVMAPAAGTPTGTVTFFDGATSLGTGTLSAGQATLTSSTLAAGSHSITAIYAGDINLLGSSSSVFTLGMQQSTTTTLVAAPNPANAGQLVTLAATVAGSSGTPTGETVTFLDGATVLGTGTTSAGGMATFTTTSLAVGSHNLTASYPGDSNFAASTSTTVTLTVLLPPVVITDNESVTVMDAVSFPDVFDAESVKVTDQVLIQVISPTTTSISAPGVIYGMPAAVAVSVSSPYGTVSGNVTLSVDGGAATTMALSSGSAVFNAGILTPGTHSLAASFPAQGNFLASSAAGSFFVSQPPAFTSANAATFIVGATGTFSVTTTGIPYPSLTVPPGTLPTGVTFTDNLNGTGTLAGIPAPGTGGIYPLTITAINGVSAAVLQSFTLAVDQAPAITSGSSTTFTEGVPGSFTLTSTGFPISALSESPTLPSGVNFFDNGDGTATLSGTPAVGTQGSYPITFVAGNGVGTNATQNFTLTINLGPAITSGSGTTFTEQMAGSFLITTMGFPVPTLTETGPLPTGITFTDNQDGTASLAGTPAVGTSNVYPITITANSAGTSTTQAFTLTVNSTAAITSGSTTTFTVGSAGFFSITAMGTPVPSLTFTGTLPTGVTFLDNGNGTATLSGTPAAGTANSYPLAITANNGVGTAAVQNFTLVVNQGAAILSGNSTTFTVGVLGTFTVMTSGSPTPTLTETPPLLPTGVTFVDNGDGTATLSGTPAAGTGGAYPLTITANNGVDLPAVQTFTLNINQNPAITSSNMVTFNELAMGSFVVTSTGNPLPTLTEVGNLPNGVTFTDNGDGTAFLGGLPAAGSGGQYGFTITAANGVLPSATQTFTLTVVPGLSFTSPSSTSFNVGAQNSFTITTAGTPTPTLTLSGRLPGGITFTRLGNGTATLSGVPLGGTEGSYLITFTAGNRTGAIATQTFTLTVQPPSVDSAPVITSANHATFAFGLVAGNGGTIPYNFFKVTTTGFPVPKLTAKFVAQGSRVGGTVSYFHDNGDGTATISFAPAYYGTDRFVITATGAGGLTTTQSFTLLIQRLFTPMFTSANQVGFTVGVLNSFTVVAGPFVDQITGGGGLPPGVGLTDNHDGTATLSGAPNGQTGTYKVTFTASNPNTNTFRKTPYTATQTFTLAVLPSVDSAPVITSANHATFAFGLVAGNGGTIPYNFFKVTTTGFPVPKLTAKFVAQGSRVGGTVSYFHDNGDGTATISFAPAYYGTDRFVITATGAGGLTTTQSFTLLIQRLFTPMFTSANQVGFTVGVLNSFTVVAGPFVDQITGGGGLPPGVGLTDNHDGTATLSGAPNAASGQTGTYKVTFTASNPNTNTVRKTPYTATQTFTLAVLPSVDSAPVITSANHATFAFGLVAGNGGTIPYNFFKVTTTGFPVPKLTAKFVAQGSRVGGTVSYFHDNGDGTATISFAPAYYGTDRFVITATGAGGLTTTQSFTLLIQRLFTPMFTSANQVGFTVGVLNSFTVVAGPFVDQITGVGGLPPGIGLTDNHDGTATLSGAPGQTGTYKVTFTASNPNTNTFRKTPYTATQTFTLAVLP